MELEPKIAKEIVQNLKDIVHHEINLFDTSGTIIASADANRIGTDHNGARLAATTKETLIIEHDNQFEGAKKGINLPVLFNDSVVAIIGITGEAEAVEPFGKIIKKMTEILIRENWVQITNFNQRMNYTNLINLMISQTADQTMIDYLASILQIDLSLPRTVIIGEFVENQQPQVNHDELFHLIYNRLLPYKHSFFSVNGQSVYILLEEIPTRDLSEILHLLLKDIENRFHHDFIFGSGNLSTSLWHSYQEAKIVMNWGQFNGGSLVKSFNELDIELILSSISVANATSLIQKVFSGVSEKELAEYERVIHAYTQHNGSVSKGAEALFIHKNTFQNKLNKFYELTGYNPRNLEDHVIISIAFWLKDYLQILAK